MAIGSITYGTTIYRGFISDNVYHDAELGDVHFSSYIPESYDGSEPYALFITIPGWDGWLFWGVGANLEYQDFGTEAQKYNPKMIVLSLQFDACDELTAKQTIAFVEYYLDNYNIDRKKVYLHGYSAGGETSSYVMSMKPELFAAYLITSSKWNGDISKTAEARVPVYMATAEKDSYYHISYFESAYNELRSLYEKQGLAEDDIDKLVVLDVRPQKYFTDKGYKRFDQHGGGREFAHEKSIMSWLFSH